jgi:site-specific recombinase XerD
MRQSSTKLTGSRPGDRPGNAGQHYRPEVLSRDEVDRLMSVISARSRLGARNRAILAVLYRGGLRVTEVLALRVIDVDPERGTVRVMNGKGSKPRTVGLDAGAMAVIQRWIDVRPRSRHPPRSAVLHVEGWRNLSERGPADDASGGRACRA